MITDVEEPLSAELPPPPEDANPDIHLARCPTCHDSVAYRLTKSGTGIIVMAIQGYEDGSSFGLSDAGLPLCPRDHGELQLEDEQIPAEDAISQVAGQLEQQNLPGVTFTFNYEGCYLQLEDMAVEVDRLHREYESDAETARASKKAWPRRNTPSSRLISAPIASRRG
jgi:hypothetical protein